MRCDLIVRDSIRRRTLFPIGCDTDFLKDDGGSTEGAQGEGGGFLWKPVSETDGSLVALLPPQYRGRATGSFVLDSGGTLLDRGVFTGDTHNGNRSHYRFPKPGQAYGGNLKLVADLNDGARFSG